MGAESHPLNRTGLFYCVAYGNGIFLQQESHGEVGMEINTLPSSFLLLSLVYPNQNPKGEREPTNEIYLGQPPVSYQRV